MKLRITLLALAVLLIAAHFLRTFSILPMLFCLAAPFLLLIKKRWSLLAVQALTVFAALIWLLTLQGIIQERLIEGRSWIPSGIILGVVTGFTFVAGWLLNDPVVRDKYP